VRIAVEVGITIVVAGEVGITIAGVGEVGITIAVAGEVAGEVVGEVVGEENKKLASENKPQPNKAPFYYLYFPKYK
jgi:hypothetical protein